MDRWIWMGMVDKGIDLDMECLMGDMISLDETILKVSQGNKP